MGVSVHSVDFRASHPRRHEVRGYGRVGTLLAVGDVFEQSVRLEFETLDTWPERMILWRLRVLTLDKWMNERTSAALYV